jgi:hypothetical protein
MKILPSGQSRGESDVPTTGSSLLENTAKDEGRSCIDSENVEFAGCSGHHLPRRMYYLSVSAEVLRHFDRSEGGCRWLLPVVAISLTSAYLGVDVDRDVS